MVIFVLMRVLRPDQFLKYTQSGLSLFKLCLTTQGATQEIGSTNNLHKPD